MSLPVISKPLSEQVKDVLFEADPRGKLNFKPVLWQTKTTPNIPDILTALKDNGFTSEAKALSSYYATKPKFGRSQLIEAIDTLFTKTHVSPSPRLSKDDFLAKARLLKSNGDVIELAHLVSPEFGESAQELLAIMEPEQFFDLTQMQLAETKVSPPSTSSAGSTPSKAKKTDQAEMLDALEVFLTTLLPEEGRITDQSKRIALQALLGFVAQANDNSLIDRAFNVVSNIVPGIDSRLAEKASRGAVILEDFIQEEGQRLSKRTAPAPSLKALLNLIASSSYTAKPRISVRAGRVAPAHLGMGLSNGPSKTDNNCFMWAMLQVMFNTPNLHQHMVQHANPAIRHLALAYKKGPITPEQARLYGYNIRESLGLEWRNQNDALEVFNRGFTPRSLTPGGSNPFVVPFSEQVFHGDTLISDNFREDSTPSHQLHLEADNTPIDELYQRQVINRHWDTHTSLPDGTMQVNRYRAQGSYVTGAPDQMVFTIQRAVGHKDMRDVNFKLGEDVLLNGEAYRLKAYVTHEGASMSGGHYVSAKENPDGSWTYYNDDIVRVISADEAKVELPQAVWAYYEKVDLPVLTEDWTETESPPPPAGMPLALSEALRAQAARK